MQFLMPAGCVTGVGSLPHTDAEEAVSFVANHCPILPFWPQLPKRYPGEGVIAQGLGPLTLLLESAGKPFCWQIRPGQSKAFADALQAGQACLIPETAAGFFAFEAAFRSGAFPRAVALKAQTEGPATLAHCLFDEGRPLASEEGAMHQVAAYVARQAVWQVKRLQKLGLPVVFVLDEPAIALALAAASSARAEEIVGAVAAVLHSVQQTGALAGLHCCAPLPVALLEKLPLDLLSFDAHLPIDPKGWIDLARSITARSGVFAFGLVPTGPEPDLGAAQLFALWLRLAATAGDALELAHKTIVTATCGLGLSTPGAAASVFERCSVLSEKIARLSQSAHGE